MDIINGNEVFVRKDCDLTIADSVGGGKVISSSGGAVRVGYYTNNNAKLTVTGGEFTVNVTSYNQSALVLKGGSFKKYVISSNWAKCSPFVYLFDGYTFALMDPASGNSYANEGNVEVDHDGSQMIRNVTVVPVPLTIDKQPTDLKFYLTSKVADKYVKLVISTIVEWQSKQFRITFEKEDGTVINEAKATAFEKQEITLSAVNFTASDSGSYRIKLEINGYVLYSDTFSITVAECEHPGYVEDNKCTQCGCDLAAVIVNGDKTMGYVTFAEALAAAQTDENKGCTLKPLTDVNEKVAVKTGSFTLDATDRTINGVLNVGNGAELTVKKGTVNGNVICAKGGSLKATITKFGGTVNCVGSGDFESVEFKKTVSFKGSLAKVSYSAFRGDLNVSGEAWLRGAYAEGTITVNSGGLLNLHAYTCTGKVVAKADSELYISGTNYKCAITAESGSKLQIASGSIDSVVVEPNCTFTAFVKAGETTVIQNAKVGENTDVVLEKGVQFGEVNVAGQKLIECIKTGTAFKDLGTGDVIDGRVGIAGNVQVVEHTHTCEWKTPTHEKLCGCGFVEATDAEAPVISGIKDGGVYYNLVYFYVTDANDFTVTVDGTLVQTPLTGYLLSGDNRTHTITATDVAGNTVTVTVTVYKLYSVTLPRDTVGYTVKGVTAVGHGMDYEFTVKIADGYSKTENYKVLVNGTAVDATKSDENGDSFLITGVSDAMIITVEGVADITPPEAEITIGTNKFKEFLNKVTFGLFFKKTQTVTVTASDAGSGLAKAEYLLSETAFADRDAVTGEWTELTLTDGKASFSVEPGRKAFVYVRVMDVSGNITVINSEGVVVYTDAEAIINAETFTIDSGSNVPYGLKLNGNSILAVYNSTEEIHELTDYSLIENGANCVLMLKNKYLRTLAAGEYTITLMFKPLGESYVDNNGNDAPSEVFLKLTVEKKTPVHDHKESDGKIYDGKPIGMPTFNTDSDGALTFEYKPSDADDTAYTTAAPKNVGKYTIRITTAETDKFDARSSSMEFEIQPREVTISGVSVGNKVYDGKVEASVVNSGMVNGLIGGDIVTVKAGVASFDNKNVGVGKTVTFTDFALSGKDAANYKLASQPQAVTADILARQVAIAGLKIKDKLYDGKNTAQFEGTPVLSGLIDGDNLRLILGVPTFDSAEIGRDISVSFTPFALGGDSTTVGNYILIQPSGVTASIREYVADGSEYFVNSNDWIHTDFTVTAKYGTAHGRHCTCCCDRRGR